MRRRVFYNIGAHYKINYVCICMYVCMYVCRRHPVKVVRVRWPLSVAAEVPEGAFVFIVIFKDSFETGRIKHCCRHYLCLPVCCLRTVAIP